MSELFERKHSQNSFLIFVDDLNLFCNKNGTNKLVAEPIENGCVKLENIEIYLSDGQIESIYLLSSGTMRQPI